MQKNKKQHTFVQARPQQQGESMIWSCPSVGSVKCNGNAALFDDGRFCIGVCIRSADGSFIKAKTVWFIGTPQPQEAEALGLLVFGSG